MTEGQAHSLEKLQSEAVCTNAGSRGLLLCDEAARDVGREVGRVPNSDGIHLVGHDIRAVHRRQTYEPNRLLTLHPDTLHGIRGLLCKDHTCDYSLPQKAKRNWVRLYLLLPQRGLRDLGSKQGCSPITKPDIRSTG